VCNIQITKGESIEETLAHKLQGLSEVLKETASSEGQVLIFHNYKAHAVEIQKYLRVHIKVLSVYLNSE